MADRMILVPASLIQGLLDDFGNRRAQAVRDARALLSQPEPSADRYQAEFEERAFPKPDACPKCRHAAHGLICMNWASDNDCNCTFITD